LLARAADLPTYLVLVQQHGTLFEAASRLPRLGELQGRGPAIVAEIAGRACVVRHYRRGGAVANLLGDRYARLAQNRVLRELQVSESARARGVATPVVACAAWYTHGLFRRFDIATTFIPGSRDLADVLFSDEPVPERSMRATVKLIRDMLRAGLVHNDLNLKNILVAPDRAYILDLDRCRIEEGVSAAASEVMRERLLRSLNKWERLTGRSAPAAARRQLAEAFGG
jgi:3-deoxy-D-manno-octulosonic acid kinase